MDLTTGALAIGIQTAVLTFGDGHKPAAIFQQKEEYRGIFETGWDKNKNFCDLISFSITQLFSKTTSTLKPGNDIMTTWGEILLREVDVFWIQRCFGASCQWYYTLRHFIAGFLTQAQRLCPFFKQAVNGLKVLCYALFLLIVIFSKCSKTLKPQENLSCRSQCVYRETDRESEG